MLIIRLLCKDIENGFKTLMLNITILIGSQSVGIPELWMVKDIVTELLLVIPFNILHFAKNRVNHEAHYKV